MPYSIEVAEAICERIALGETLRSICRSPDMPSYRTVYKWLEQQPEFDARFARARDLGYDMIAMEALEIADTPVMGQVATTKEWGDEIKQEDMLGHRKLQVHTRLQLLAKWSAKYREKSETQITGKDGGPIQLDDATAAARIAALLERASKRKQEEDGLDLV